MSEAERNDNKDANTYIIESVPLAGMTRRLIDNNQAMQIRARIAQALGLEDEELAHALAQYYRTGTAVNLMDMLSARSNGLR